MPPEDRTAANKKAQGDLIKVKPHSPLRRHMTAIGVLLFGFGCFVLTFTGIWIWIGAALWGLSGLCLATGLIDHVENPTPDPDKKAELENRIALLDQNAEVLQDQNWELREAAEKYKALLEEQGDIVLHIGDEGIIQFANPAFDAYFDHEQKTNPFIRIEPDNKSGLALGIDSAEPLCEQRIETLAGLRWFRWTRTVMRNANKDKTQHLIIARDITAHKKTKAASEAKSRFLATISHEMRTPLNGVIGMASLLEATELTPEQLSYSQALRQSGTSLLALVNDVLDLSRIEAGKLTLHEEWVSPARLVEDVVELLAPDAQDKGLSIATWVATSIPDRICSDPVRIRQILINLLGNAIKFTEKGAINLSLEIDEDEILHQIDRDNEKIALKFSVRDTGPGISPEQQIHLFEEFEQADTSRTRQHEGAGLGLAISKRLAHLLKGDIICRSEPGLGATFSLQIKVPQINDTADIDRAGDFKGQNLLGLDLTQADRRALYAYCCEWQMSCDFLSLQEWQESGSKKPVDHLLINGADPEKAANILAEFDPARSGDLTQPPPKSRSILLEPRERHVIPQMRDSGISAYLVKPVRKASLLFALTGEAQKDRPGPNPDSGPDGEPAQEATSGNIARTQDNKAKSPNILVVEDNEINALLTRSILTKAGMVVTLASSASEALALYQTGQQNSSGFDLALVDLHMPDMDGFHLFEEMAKLDQDTGTSCPKLAFTADGLEETRRACLKHGFSAHIAKPADPDHLLMTIRQALKA